MPITDTLIVPIELQSWVVNNDKALTGRAHRRATNNYSSLKRFSSPEPSPFDNLNNKPNMGIYLQWSLPAGLQHGLRPAADQPIAFPCVPNRWLIVRVYGPLDQRSTLAWVVESDAIVKTADNSSPFPHPDPKQGEVRIGKKIPLSEWSLTPTTPNQYLERLSAVGNGDILFSAYQPHNLNVFSIHDPLTDLKDDKEEILSYFACGWYADLGSDPIHILKQFLATEREKSPDKKEDELLKACLDKMQHDYFWKISDTDIEAGIMKSLSRSLYQGISANILWDKRGKVPHSKQPPGNAATIQVAIGNTSLDALEALLEKAEDSAGIPPLLLKAFHQGLLKKLAEVDGEEELMHAQHQADFGSSSGGTHWEIVAKTTSAAEAHETSENSLPAPFLQVLNDLNQRQAALDYQTRLLKSNQWKLYSLWWKNGYFNSYNNNSLSGNKRYQEIFGKLEEAIASNVKPGVKNFFVTVKLQQKKISDLKDELKNLSQALTEQLEKYSPPQTLKIQPNDPFWQPLDPVLLVTGINSSGLSNRNDTLRCRSAKELLTEISFKDATTGQELTKKIGDIKLDFSKLPTGISELWQEFLIIDYGLSKPGTSIQATANNTEQKLPFFGTTPWSQPWQPLLMEWDLDWTAIPFTDWKFDAVTERYILDKKTDASLKNPISHSGRIFLTPQASFSFKSKFEILIKQHPELIETFKKNDVDPKDFIKQIAQWDVLSQRLSGLHAQFAMRDRRINRLPSQLEPGYQSVIGQQVSEAPNYNAQNAPAKSSNFQPLRQGQFYITNLSVVDSFGQAIDIMNPENPLLKGIYISEDLRPDDRQEKTPNIVQLSPRIVQATRLRLDWIDAKEDTKALVFNAEANPVCGWLLPNYLEQSIQVFNPEGFGLGELYQTQQGLVWDSIPYGHETLESLSQNYPHLGQMLSSLKAGKQGSYNDLLSAIDKAFTVKTMPTTRYLRYFSAYAGRPLALVRSKWQFEFNEPCYQDQSWSNTKNILDSLSIAESPSMLNQASALDKEFIGKSFNLRFGNPNLSQDGLIGYFQKKDYEQFYSVYPLDATSSTYLKTIDGSDCKLQLSAPSEILTTLLIDPMFSIHIYTDILPVNIHTLPMRFIHSSLQHMEMTFKTGPLLIQRPLSPPAQGFTTLKMPKPGLGDWAWLETNLVPETSTPIKRFDITAEDANARFESNPYHLVEGFLSAKLPATSTQSISLSSKNQSVVDKIKSLRKNYAAVPIVPITPLQKKQEDSVAMPKTFTPARQMDIVRKIQQLKTIDAKLGNLLSCVRSQTTIESAQQAVLEDLTNAIHECDSPNQRQNKGYSLK